MTSLPSPIPIPVPFPSIPLDDLSQHKRPRADDDDGDRDRDRSRRRLSLPSLHLADGGALYVPPHSDLFRPSSAPHNPSPLALAQHLRARAHLRPQNHAPPRYRRPGQMMDVDPAVAVGVEIAPDTTYPPPADPSAALANVRFIASLEPAVAAQLPHEQMASAIVTLLSFLHPADQDVFARVVLREVPVQSLGGEDLWLLARELVEMDMRFAESQALMQERV